MPRPGFYLPLFLWVASALPAQAPAPPETPEEIRILAAAADPARWPGAATAVLWDGTEIRVEESGLGHTRLHRVEKALTAAGARALAVGRYDFDPASNLVEIEAARVVRRDGQVREVPAAAILDLPQPQHAIIWGPRMKLVPFGRLEPGDVVEVRLYRKGFLIAYLAQEDDERFIPPMRGHFYDSIVFQEGAPLLTKLYRLRLPRTKPLRFLTCNGEVASAAAFDEEHLVYSFWRRDVAPFRAEPRAVAASDQCPKVVLATTRTWEEKSRWFWGVQEERKIFANEPRTDGLPGGEEEVRELRELVARLTTGLSREEQIRALNHWVADNIRYMGISMGKGEGYTIHPGVMVLRNRCGVCKDKAGMLATLLRAAGFEAYCGMTMAGARVEEIPADQFNHCITAVREPDGTLRLLDPTWIPLSPEMWSSAESEQHYVLGTEAGETLRATPLYGPDHNRLTVQVRSVLDAGGGLQADVEMAGTNYADQRLRRALFDAPQAQVPSLFGEWAAGLAPGARLEWFRYDPETMTRYDRPAPAAFRLTADAYAHRGPGVMVLAPTVARPFLQAVHAPFLGVPLTAARSQDLALWCTRGLALRERLALPEGWKVRRLPEARELDGPAMSLSYRVFPAAGGTALEVELDLALKLRTLPARLYPQFREVVQAYQELALDPVVLEPAGPGSHAAKEEGR